MDLHIPMELRTILLQLVALSPIAGEKDLQYLQSLMVKPGSKYDIIIIVLMLLLSFLKSVYCGLN